MSATVHNNLKRNTAFYQNETDYSKTIFCENISNITRLWVSLECSKCKFKIKICVLFFFTGTVFVSFAVKLLAICKRCNLQKTKQIHLPTCKLTTSYSTKREWRLLSNQSWIKTIKSMKLGLNRANLWIFLSSNIEAWNMHSICFLYHSLQYHRLLVVYVF